MSKVSYLHKANKNNLKNHERIQQMSSLGLHNLKNRLNGQSHIFIVTLGSLIGAAVALAIMYSLSATWMSYLFLIIIPVCVSYILRKVYIYTLINYSD